jgi:hypothetical protein
MAGSQQALLSGGSVQLVYVPASVSYFDGSLAPADSFAGVQYTSAGDIYKCEGNTLTYTDTTMNWLLVGSAADYWIRATYTGDAPNGGSAVNSWLQLSTTRSWSVGVTGNQGLLSSTLTISIATDSGGSNIIATGLCYIEATVEL